MSSEKPTPVADEEELENVELHRAESMIDPNPPRLTPDPQKDTDPGNPPSVVLFVGEWARSVTSRIPNVTAELIMFLYMFSYVMRSVSSTAMILDKACLVHLGYPEEVCDDLKDYPAVKSEVTKMATNYGLGHTMFQMLPSSVMALFIGSWSDKYGRKFPMILALVGIILDGIGTSLCAYFLRSRLEFYFLPAVFTGCSGGMIGVMAVLYSYASDTSDPSNRTMKYATMQLAFGMAMPLGSLVGGWVFQFYGYVTVFVASTCGHVLGLCCVVVCLRETRGLECEEGLAAKFRAFWSLEGVRSSLKTTAQKRANKGRKQIWLLILAMTMVVFSYASLSSVAFLYAHYVYDWDNAWYSTVSAIYMVIGFSLMMTIVPLSRRFNVGEAALGILGSVSFMLRNVGIGLAIRPWIYHLAMSLGLFNSLAMLAARSRISKVVPKDDLGKVFAFTSTAESLLPIAATTIVTQAFTATLDFFPGLIFIVMGATMLVPLGVFIWIFRLPATPSNEETKKNQDQEANMQASEEPSSTKM